MIWRRKWLGLAGSFSAEEVISGLILGGASTGLKGYSEPMGLRLATLLTGAT